MTYFAHHGMIYVPFGFASAHLFDNSEVIGGSAYGAGTVGKVQIDFKSLIYYVITLFSISQWRWISSTLHKGT